MRIVLKRLMLMIYALTMSATGLAADEMRLAVTTSFHNSGLAEVLLPEIKKDIGLDVQLLVVGTGQALRLGEAGDVDAILVHARASEEAFITAGHGSHRREIMYNDFIIIGPKADPANVGGATDILQAMQQIGTATPRFVSRGDDSGTHKKEMSLWAEVGITPEEHAWYSPVGAGMGAALNTASGLGAYILSDRASWLNFGNKGDLVILFEGDAELFNQYAYLPVNPDKHAHVKAGLAVELENWLTSDRAQALINGYRLQGVQLFTFNAK